MNDKQLLELAAKAAGIRLEWDGDPKYWTPMYYEGKTYHTWNPLTDDGDALRLAVMLELEVCTTNVRDTVTNEVYGAALVIGPDTDCFEKHKYDPYAATRRAIVRAAAEIGRGME
jgi:hypothetical protein